MPWRPGLGSGSCDTEVAGGLRGNNESRKAEGPVKRWGDLVETR
jgi:hypothetical protein